MHWERRLTCVGSGAVDPTPPSWPISEAYDPLVDSVMEGSRIVHGRHWLPQGYQLAILPTHAIVVPFAEVRSDATLQLPDHPPSVRLSCSHNALKIAITLFQTIASVVTLYRTRGDQIDRYGFAAFGLTVVPYTIMSTVNLLGGILTPAYPTLYLVRSPEMEEAKTRGGLFDGVVGTVVEARTGVVEDGTGVVEDEITYPAYSAFRSRDAYASALSASSSSAAALLLFPLPYVIIFALTHFRPANSTQGQRAWLMSWLALGVFAGSGAPNLRAAANSIANSSVNVSMDSFTYKYRIFNWVVFIVVYPVAAIGGMITVGHMIKGYGTCVKI